MSEIKKEKDYQLKCKIEIIVGDYTKEEISEAGAMGCDAIAVIPIVRDPKGRSFLFFGADGATKREISDEEVFYVFNYLANQLVMSVELPEWKIQAAKVAVAAVKHTAGFLEQGTPRRILQQPAYRPP